MNRLLHLALIPLSFALLCGCGASTRCVTGESNACACVDGKMGAQSCQADGTYAACQCGSSLCNANNCNGCCDASGACQTGTSNTACGGAAQLCVACGLAQTCQLGVCTSAGSGGGAGGGGGSGGGGGTSCGPANCGNGCCDAAGRCQYPSNTGSMLCGSAGGACSTCTANQICAADTCTTVKRIFATKTGYNGSLGGLTGADQKCMTAAQAALVSGTWKAWLSDGSTDAISRIADVGPWYRLSPSKEKVKLFNNKTNLTTLPFDDVGINEDGAYFSAAVWTGTVVGGTRSTVHCSNWTSALSTATGQDGDNNSSDANWTQAALFGNECNLTKSIYCIEQ